MGKLIESARIQSLELPAFRFLPHQGKDKVPLRKYQHLQTSKPFALNSIMLTEGVLFCVLIAHLAVYRLKKNIFQFSSFVRVFVRRRYWINFRISYLSIGGIFDGHIYRNI